MQIAGGAVPQQLRADACDAGDLEVVAAAALKGADAGLSQLEKGLAGRGLRLRQGATDHPIGTHAAAASVITGLTGTATWRTSPGRSILSRLEPGVAVHVQGTIAIHTATINIVMIIIRRLNQVQAFPQSKVDLRVTTFCEQLPTRIQAFFQAMDLQFPPGPRLEIAGIPHHAIRVITVREGIGTALLHREAVHLGVRGQLLLCRRDVGIFTGERR